MGTGLGPGGPAMAGAGAPSLLLAVGALVGLAALGGGHTASVAPLCPSFVHTPQAS